MAQILLRRLLMMLVILFLLSVITFILMHTSDSDPVKLYMIRSGIIPTPELIAEVRARYGLDEPIWCSISYGCVTSSRAISATRCSSPCPWRRS